MVNSELMFGDPKHKRTADRWFRVSLYRINREETNETLRLQEMIRHYHGDTGSLKKESAVTND